MLTLQELIRRLTAFWEKKGCIIHQGHDVEVGAGTFNPATFLRCLGPEPYHTAYVEPSRRPADARFGQNPNRIQLFHQFQVILKPSPPDIQKNYLQSLKAVGFDLDKHDIRFVHDDWESPTLGAWGLGWEVWCDGMEVSQFTYFQAMASLPLKPVSGEITYGLERLCMFLQNVDNMLDIQWNDKLTLGDVSRQNEIEWSTYNFLESSPEMWLKHFGDYEKEAKQLVAKNLPIPAYDFVIKASHAFNMLDARGVISTTERTGYIGRIRDLARLVASSYIASREKQNFPLIKETPAAKTIKTKKNRAAFDSGKKRDFLLEIGSEELPATFVPIGCRNLEKEIRSLLDSRALSYDKIEVFGTPRRLSVLIHSLVEGSATTRIEKKGPPLSQVIHPDGTWTAQGEGFLKSLSLSKISLEELRQGKSKELSVKPLKDIDYLFATVTQKGKATSQILAENLPHLITTLDFPKKMSWGNLDITYARPLRWIIALFGETVVSFAVGDIVSSNFSYGHAQRDPVKFRVNNPQEYVKALKDHFVIASIEERKQMILSQLTQIKTQLGASTPQESRVLNEVVHLSEFPELALGHFNPAYLKAPKELLISEMVEHQRYFPLEKNHELINSFIITCDRMPTELIVQGNQKVLSARLADGLFLFEQDATTPLEELSEKLKAVTFQEKLGTIADKVARMQVCAEMINKTLHRPTPDAILKKAVSLCKADLTSGCVKEFPELQGTIGKYIALAQGKEKEIALAIEEHWLPKAEGGALPKTPCGIVLSLADKIDNLISYFKVGLKPSSSSDPYALRRQAIGIIRLVLEHKYNLHLTPLLVECGSPQQVAQEIVEFIKARAKGVFEEQGFLKDEIEASIPEDSNLYDWVCRLKALHTVRKTSEFRDFCEMHKRMKGFLSTSTNEEQKPFNETLLQAPEEKALYLKLKAEKPHILKLIQERNYEKAYQELIAFKELLKAFADNVKVHDDNLEIRANRERLLKEVFSLFAGLVELSKLSL